jgi:DNA-binding response OmpR family regulator
MTPIEGALLAYLARNAGHVCTRAVLLREVWRWENAWEVQTRTVDVTVCRLRRLLPQGVSIETLRGLGYRYVAVKA